MAQGLVFWSVHTWWPEAEPLRAAAMGAVSFAVVAGLATQFAWTGRDRVRLLTITGLTGAVFALCAMWVWLQIPPRSAPNAGDGDRVRSWWVAAFVALYALGPYLQVYQRTGRPRFAYGDLFFHCWCNFL